MELRKINDKVFYYPHQPETDRPMLAYIKGDKFALAVDAGNSADHVDEFYKALEVQKLKRPDFTVITHWHWDHTFGMHRINGLSIGHNKTNKFLAKEKAKILDETYLEFLKDDNKCFGKEYENNKKVVIVEADIQFQDSIDLNLGRRTAKIFHAESPHSDDTVLIYIPEEKILFLGDATSEDFFNDGFMDQEKLRALISLIEKTDCKFCILGHTEPLIKSDLLYYLKSIEV